MLINNFEINGLTNEQVIKERKKYGRNQLNFKKTNNFWNSVFSLLTEPMIILLFVTATIYFISGKPNDGIYLSTAILLVATISLFQDSRSRNALEKLKIFTQPNAKVIRNGIKEEIKSEDLVVGDYLIVEEGSYIPTDGTIIHSNDFSVNESILTGESMAVYKDISIDINNVYSGTTVNTGLAIVCVTAIGNETKLGKIGKSIESIKEEKTPLEIQIGNFVKKMVIAGAIIFISVWAINYYRSSNPIESLLKALTLAMSILPEEIPIAFTTFMALGSWRLMKMGIIVKQMKTVETLGSATTICTDKTGTITENEMTLAKLAIPSSNKITNTDDVLNVDEKELIEMATWASEPIPFDPMEIALHNAFTKLIITDERAAYKLIHEYPLEGKPPMMTHIFENQSGKRIIAAKGAPEAILKLSILTDKEKQQIEKSIYNLANEGYRILGVGESSFNGTDFPSNQNEYKFKFMGILGFYDPPKKNISTVLESFNKAGIVVKIITGDIAATTTAIASQIGLKNYKKNISGDELLKLSNIELQKRVSETNIFTRMYPEAKLRIINALKSNNEIVAMTGDGINDGPALKAAHIGIAMGKKGTEIAKQAASLILVEDDLGKMIDAVAMGRQIYANLKKAIQYIISIHIPIVLTVFIPLAFSWIYPTIFSPIHIIFLELIMGPTCSIIYENEPIEKNIMEQKPRPFANTFFNWKELTISIVQGLLIAVGTLVTYQYAVYLGYNETITRTMVFSVLISANIFLTLINRSFYYSILTTIKYKNNLVLLIIAITITISALLIYLKPLAQFFLFESLYFGQMSVCIFIGFISVMWYEIVKLLNRMHKHK